jgi:DNA-binding transcriptional regulator YiaG
MALKELVRNPKFATKTKHAGFSKKKQVKLVFAKSLMFESGHSASKQKSQPQDLVEVQVAKAPKTQVYSGIVEMKRASRKVPRGDFVRLRSGVALAAEKKLADDLISELETSAETAADVNSLCDNYGLKREELGRLTGFSLRALADWAGGKVPSQPAHRRLHEVRRLLDALAELVRAEAITPWLQAKNPAFGNLTPLQVIEMGEIDRLWAMVHQGAAGPLD